MTSVVVSRTAEGGAYVARMVGSKWVLEHQPPEGKPVRLGDYPTRKGTGVVGRLLARRAR